MKPTKLLFISFTVLLSISCSKHASVATADNPKLTDLGDVLFINGQPHSFKMDKNQFCILVPQNSDNDHLKIAVVFQDTETLNPQGIPGAIKVTTTPGQTVAVSKAEAGVRFTPRFQ